MDQSKPYREERPWGDFEQFMHNEVGTAKIITIKKGQRNSLQYHKLRDEQWKILDGPIKVTLGNKEKLEEKIGNEGDIFLVPAGTWHRFEGMGDKNRLLEVARGDFQEIDDNYRIEDDYGRK